MKVRINITVDLENYQLAKLMGMNISEVCNMALTHISSGHSDNKTTVEDVQKIVDEKEKEFIHAQKLLHIKKAEMDKENTIAEQERIERAKLKMAAYNQLDYDSIIRGETTDADIL